MEATLALVKPDALAARDAIVTIAENAGLFVSRGIDTRLTPEVASGLYLKCVGAARAPGPLLLRASATARGGTPALPSDRLGWHGVLA